MNDWITVADSIGDLLTLIAAIITLVAARRGRDKK